MSHEVTTIAGISRLAVAIAAEAGAPMEEDGEEVEATTSGSEELEALDEAVED